MKMIVAFFVMVVGLFAAADARASGACGGNMGVAPRRGSALPPRAQLVVFDTFEHDERFEVRIAGKKVPITIERRKAAPFFVAIVQVDSDATGELVLYREWMVMATAPKTEEGLGFYARYTVKKDVKLADQVTGQVRSFYHDIRHSTVKETYDALFLDLGEERHAVRATVKLRRDAKAAWQTIDVPVSPGDSLDDHPAVRIGQLGCKTNVSADLLRGGVDLEVTLTMTDGSTRKLELPARVKLAPPPPPPPAPPPVPPRRRADAGGARYGLFAV